MDVVDAKPPQDRTLYVGELEIRVDEGLVLASGTALVLSLREFDLIVALAERKGSIVSRGELYERVWRSGLRPGDRSVDVYVSKLRNKLRAAAPDRAYIHTHPGFGYRLQSEPSQRVYIRETQADQTAASYARIDPQPRPEQETRDQ